MSKYAVSESGFRAPAKQARGCEMVHNRHPTQAQPGRTRGVPYRALAALALAAAITLPTSAKDHGLPPHVERYIADARLSGSGKLTWWGFHVYDASLYARGELDPRAPTAQPFVLELRYARSLSGPSIAEASLEEIARLGFGNDAQRTAWHQQLQRLFPDVRAGQTLAGVNLPGRGARFYFDGRLIGAIEDADFARAFFAIWLDPRTQAPKLREQLLAKGQGN